MKETYESSASIISTTKTYDALGRVSTVSNPSRGNDGLGFLTTTVYDGLGRPRSVTTQADGAVSSTSYSGNQTTAQDQEGRQRTMTTDGLGRLAQVVEDPGSTAGTPPAHLNYVTNYGYDALDDLIAVSQSG